MADVAREYGVSRKTAYKWLQRYRKQGLTGLVDESRRPASSPMATTAELAFEVIEVRRKHPSWGPKKIAAVLQRKHPGEDTPSLSTVARILRHAGLMKRRTRRSSGGIPMRAPEFVPKAPNDLWTVDFKGWWRSKDGNKCEPLTIRDAHTRFIFSLRLMSRTRTEDVRPVFEELFRRYGLPMAIQSDNGPPFASVRAPRGLTELSAWWVSLGIQVVRSRPGCPQDNGAHERMHVDVRFDLEDNAEATRDEQQRACDDWVTVFNFERPHEALAMKVPGDVYRASERRMTRYVIGGYPQGCEMANVSTSGKITYGDRKFFISVGVSRHRVGLLPIGDAVQVWFYQLLLGSFPRTTEGHFEPYIPHEDDPPESNKREGTTTEGAAVLPDVTASPSPA